VSDLKLKSVYLRNWMKYAEAAVQFPDSGVVVVTGSNLASGGKLLSVGSGKTGLGEAVSRALFGVTGRFASLRQFSTGKKGNTYIKVEAELLGQPLVVEMGYKCPELSSAGEALRFSYNGKTIERGKIQETRQELAKTVGVTAHLAEWTVFIDGDKIKFDRMSEQDTVELLMASLSQPPWTEYHAKAKETLRQFKQAKGEAEARHGECVRRVATAKDDALSAETDLATAKRTHAQRVKQVESERKRENAALTAFNESLSESKVRREAIVKEVNALVETDAETAHRLEIRRNEFNDTLTDLQEQRDPLVQEQSDASAAYTAANKLLTTLKSTPKDCPTCGKPWDKAHSAEEIEKQSKVVQGHCTDYRKAAKKLADHDALIKNTRTQLNEAEEDLRAKDSKEALNTLRNEDADLEQKITDTLADAHQAELRIQKLETVDDSAVKACEATLKERKRVVTDAVKSVTEAVTAVAEATASLAVVDYWTRAYSPVGIPNMLLEEAIGPLNHEARRVSALMTGSTIDVSFAASRQLVSGDTRAELVINVDNRLGSDELQGSSKGEAGLTNFIIAETLSEVGRVAKRVGYRWYDEVVPHQDPVVCHSIYTYLREIAERYGILIFLVDHNPIAANYADYVLVAEKTDKGTTLRWD